MLYIFLRWLLQRELFPVNFLTGTIKMLLTRPVADGRFYYLNLSQRFSMVYSFMLLHLPFQHLLVLFYGARQFRHRLR